MAYEVANRVVPWLGTRLAGLFCVNHRPVNGNAKLTMVTTQEVRLGRADYGPIELDRKSTRLNSSHVSISYAVFCLKKKNKWEWSERLRYHMTTPRLLPSNGE